MTLQKTSTGQLLRVADGLARECCCGGVCPDNCDACADPYQVTVPAGSFCDIDFFDNSVWVFTWSSQTFSAAKIFLPCYWQGSYSTFAYNEKMYESGTCAAPVNLLTDTNRTDGNVTVGISCGGTPEHWTAEAYISLYFSTYILGTKSASPCPPGTYTNGFSVA